MQDEKTSERTSSDTCLDIQDVTYEKFKPLKLQGGWLKTKDCESRVSLRQIVNIAANDSSCENAAIHLRYTNQPLLMPNRKPDDKLTEVTVKLTKYDGVKAVAFYFRDISEQLLPSDENLVGVAQKP